MNPKRLSVTDWLHFLTLAITLHDIMYKNKSYHNIISDPLNPSKLTGDRDPPGLPGPSSAWPLWTVEPPCHCEGQGIPGGTGQVWKEASLSVHMQDKSEVSLFVFINIKWNFYTCIYMYYNIEVTWYQYVHIIKQNRCFIICLL